MQRRATWFSLPLHVQALVLSRLESWEVVHAWKIAPTLPLLKLVLHSSAGFDQELLREIFRKSNLYCFTNLTAVFAIRSALIGKHVFVFLARYNIGRAIPVLAEAGMFSDYMARDLLRKCLPYVGMHESSDYVVNLVRVAVALPLHFFADVWSLASLLIPIFYRAVEFDDLPLFKAIHAEFIERQPRVAEFFRILADMSWRYNPLCLLILNNGRQKNPDFLVYLLENCRAWISKTCSRSAYLGLAAAGRVEELRLFRKFNLDFSCLTERDKTEVESSESANHDHIRSFVHGMADSLLDHILTMLSARTKAAQAAMNPNPERLPLTSYFGSNGFLRKTTLDLMDFPEAALYISCVKRHTSFALEILREGIESPQDLRSQYSSLVQACRLKNLVLIKELLEQGASLDTTGSNSPLLEVIGGGCLQALSLLRPYILPHHLEATNKASQTVFSIANRRGPHRLLRALQDIKFSAPKRVTVQRMLCNIQSRSKRKEPPLDPLKKASVLEFRAANIPWVRNSRADRPWKLN